jgi:hypothetical protein
MQRAVDTAATTVVPVVQSAVDTAVTTVGPVVQRAVDTVDTTVVAPVVQRGVATIAPVLKLGVETVDAIVAPVVQRGVETVVATVTPVVQRGVDTIGTSIQPTLGPVLKTATDIVGDQVRPVGIVVTTAPRLDVLSRDDGAVTGTSPVGSPRSTSAAPSHLAALPTGTPSAVAPEPQLARPTVQAPQSPSRFVTPTSAVARAGGGGTQPAFAALLTPGVQTAPLDVTGSPDRQPSAAPAQAAGHESSAAPAGVTASSGAAGSAGPAPFGGALFALSLAAMSLAAALCFVRLLHPPAQWRPVFLVSLIERPG